MNCAALSSRSSDSWKFRRSDVLGCAELLCPVLVTEWWRPVEGKGTGRGCICSLDPSTVQSPVPLIRSLCFFRTPEYRFKFLVNWTRLRSPVCSPATVQLQFVVCKLISAWYLGCRVGEVSFGRFPKMSDWVFVNGPTCMNLLGDMENAGSGFSVRLGGVRRSCWWWWWCHLSLIYRDLRRVSAVLQYE